MTTSAAATAAANDTTGKHMVWTEHPTTGAQIGIAYSTLKEAEIQAIAFKNLGYKVLRIVPSPLPKPNASA